MQRDTVATGCGQQFEQSFVHRECSIAVRRIGVEVVKFVRISLQVVELVYISQPVSSNKLPARRDQSVECRC